MAQVKPGKLRGKAPVKVPAERWNVARGGFINFRVGGPDSYGYRANRERALSAFGGQDAALLTYNLADAYKILAHPVRLTFNVKSGPTKGQRRTLYGDAKAMRRAQKKYGGVLDKPTVGRPIIVWGIRLDPFEPVPKIKD